MDPKSDVTKNFSHAIQMRALILVAFLCLASARYEVCDSHWTQQENLRVDVYNPTGLGIVQAPAYAVGESVDFLYFFAGDTTAHRPQTLTSHVPFPANFSDPASLAASAIGQTRRLFGLEKRIFGSASLDFARDVNTLRIQASDAPGVLAASVETALSILEQIGARPALTFLATPPAPIEELILFAGVRGFNNTQADVIEASRDCSIPREELWSEEVSDILYAHGVRVWNIGYTSGINGTGESLYEQSYSALERIASILNSANDSWQIASISVYLNGTEQDEEEFYTAYTTFFADPDRRPVIRALVQNVAFLDSDDKVLIEAVAEFCDDCLEFRSSPTVYSNRTLGPQAVVTPSAFVISSEVYGTINWPDEPIEIYSGDVAMYTEPPYNKTQIEAFFETIAPGFGSILFTQHETEVAQLVQAFSNLMEVIDMGHSTLKDIVFLEVSFSSLPSIFATWVAQEIAYRGIPAYPPARTDHANTQLRSELVASGVSFSLAATAAPFRVRNYISRFSGISNFPMELFQCPEGTMNPFCPVQ